MIGRLLEKKEEIVLGSYHCYASPLLQFQIPFSQPPETL